uniref:Uncharacterized protein n=1 Tax=Leersia perrieri TaxID=77586 RepID=A0A0D9VB81_9ORYZ
MAALRLAARKLAGVGPRAPTNIQAVIGSSSRPATAAATAIEEGQRRLPALASCCFYPSRRFSSGPRPKFSAFDAQE